MQQLQVFRVHRSRLRSLLAMVVFAALVIALRRLAEVRRLRRAAIDRGRRWIEARVALARSALTHRMESHVELALNSCADRMRILLKDPAMPFALQRTIDVVLDGLLPDIKHESYRVLDEHLLPGAKRAIAPTSHIRGFSPLSPRRSREQRLLRVTSPGGRGDAGGPRRDGYIDRSTPQLLQLLRRTRAVVLHTLWPHNRSLWANMRSPGWWILQLLGMLPFVGPLWWLLLSSAVDKQDEYQLCQFIVALRCTHFVTIGMCAALYGCVQAYRCAAFATGPVDCVLLAPKLGWVRGLFWLAQLVIATRAFMLLPYSKKKGQRVTIERRERLSLETRRALAAGDVPSPEAAIVPAAQPGGVLMRMAKVDLALAALVLCAAAVATLMSRGDAQVLPVTLFWIRTAHGLLSFPYVMLRLPGANTLLTHARRTGYDQYGYCVPWDGLRRVVARAAAPTPSRSGSPSATTAAAAAAAAVPCSSPLAVDATAAPVVRRLFVNAE
jgi:hypothetical protein